MTANVRTIVGVLASFGGIAVAAAVLNGRETSLQVAPSTERLMYLQSGQVADRLFLTFDALAADVYWIRAIQHYGRDRKSSRTTDRFQLLQPFLDLTTTLDPHFNIAYRFGAIFLSLDPPNGPGNVKDAIALLEKGLAANPRRWQYAHDIGFIHYWYMGNYSEAARWFEKAASMPGAPEWIEPLAAVTLAQGGDRQGARRLLTELAGSNETYIRNAATRSLAQLGALDFIDALQRTIEAYHTKTGRYPDDWAELVRARAIPGPPIDPTGTPMIYDQSSHTVTLSKQSTLQPLPRALGKS